MDGEFTVRSLTFKSEQFHTFTNILVFHDSWAMNKWLRELYNMKDLYNTAPLSSSPSSTPLNNYVQWFYRNKFCMANKWDWIGSTCFQFRDHIMNTWNLFIWLLIMRNFLEFIPCVEQYIYKICTRMQFNRIVLVIINGWPRISIHDIHNSSK